MQSRDEVLTELLVATPRRARGSCTAPGRSALAIDGWHVAVQLDFEDLADPPGGEELGRSRRALRLADAALQAVRAAGGSWHGARTGGALVLVEQPSRRPGRDRGRLACANSWTRSSRRSRSAAVDADPLRRRQRARRAERAARLRRRGQGGDDRGARTSERANTAVPFDSAGLRRTLIEWYASDTAREAVTTVLAAAVALGGARAERLITTLHVYLDERGSMTRAGERPEPAPQRGRLPDPPGVRAARRRRGQPGRPAPAPARLPRARAGLTCGRGATAPGRPGGRGASRRPTRRGRGRRCRREACSIHGCAGAAHPRRRPGPPSMRAARARASRPRCARSPRALLSVGPAHDDRVDRAGVRVQELPRRGDGDAGRGRAQRHVPDDVGPAAAERLAQRGGEGVVEDDDVAGLDPVAGERLAVARALGVLGMLAPAETARLTAQPGRRGQRAREAQRLVELPAEGAERLVRRDLEFLRDDAPVGRQAAAQRMRCAAPGGQRGRAPHGAPAEAVGCPLARRGRTCARAARSTAVRDDRSPRSASLSFLSRLARGRTPRRRSTVAVGGPAREQLGVGDQEQAGGDEAEQARDPEARVTGARTRSSARRPRGGTRHQRRQRPAAHRGAPVRGAAPAQAGAERLVASPRSPGAPCDTARRGRADDREADGDARERSRRAWRAGPRPGHRQAAGKRARVLGDAPADRDAGDGDRGAQARPSKRPPATSASAATPAPAEAITQTRPAPPSARGRARARPRARRRARRSRARRRRRRSRASAHGTRAQIVEAQALGVSGHVDGGEVRRR